MWKRIVPLVRRIKREGGYIRKRERVVIGADLNGNFREGKRGNEDILESYVSKERNKEGQMAVDFAKKNNDGSDKYLL